MSQTKSLEFSKFEAFKICFACLREAASAKAGISDFIHQTNLEEGE